MPAGKPGRIGVLVVDPHVHVELFGLVQRDLPEPEPLVAQVGRHQSRPRMHEDLHHLLAGQIAHRAADLLFRQHVVPHPQGCRGILAGRSREDFRAAAESSSLSSAAAPPTDKAAVQAQAHPQGNMQPSHKGLPQSNGESSIRSDRCRCCTRNEYLDVYGQSHFLVVMTTRMTRATANSPTPA